MKKGWISLSFRHSKKDLTYLSDALGLQQSHGWVAGEPWVTKGGVTKAPKPDNYWNGGFAFTQERGFAVDVMRAVSLLQKEEVNIDDLIVSGGDVVLTINFQGIINNGDEINNDTLRKISELGIKLGIEVFPVEQNWHD